MPNRYAQKTYTIKEVAALLGVGERALFKELRDRRILDSNNLPTPGQRKQGRWIIKQGEWESAIGRHPYGQTLATAEGIRYLRRVLHELIAAA